MTTRSLFLAAAPLGLMLSTASATDPGSVAPAGPGLFRFTSLAPSAKQVAVRGAWSNEPLVLTRDQEGRWTATAGPISPGTYDYNFVVDSPTAAPTDTARILHVPTPGNPEYPANAPHGTVHAHRYASKALGITRECWVYTPPGYEAGGKDYPFLVLQHAGADTQKTWVAKGHVDWLLDQLIAAGRARPMVVLMLDGHPHGEAVYFKPATRLSAMRDLEHELLDDAIPLVEKNYRIASIRDLRAVAGPSVGGGQMISIGLAHLDHWAWIGVFSAGHGLPEFYAPALAAAAATNAQLKLFWISCATGDEQFKANETFVAELTARGIRHEWYPTAGAHAWSVWRRDLTEYLCRLFQPDAATDAR